MKRLLFLFLIPLFFCCEKEDVCVEQPTPDLLIGFYSIDQETQDTILTNQNGLNVIVLGENTDTLLQNSVSRDTLHVPFDFDSEQIQFSIQREDEEVDTVTVNYSPNLEYVNKACGFIYQFRFNNISSTNNDIKAIDQRIDLIQNENQVHLRLIYPTF